jgi:uncharacterized protein YecE (DUF72 family)
MNKKNAIYVGTSGWKYKHWNKNFYPEDLKIINQLDYYQSKFNTVELNNSFYREPKAEQFVNWKNEVGTSFLYAVKANRYFTHLKKLKVTQDEILSFIEKASHLEEKLGPILFQLPPSWKINIERLSNFLELLPKHFKYTFEFRNQSWYSSEVYELLTKHNCAFCIYELAGHISPFKVTADFVYVRLHGPGEKYQGSYTTQALKKWVKQSKEWQKQGKTVFIYFDNDQEGYAAFNALQLIDILKKT